jgi:hypothetical protein
MAADGENGFHLVRKEFHLPLREVCCPFCTRWVEIDGMSMIETLWMHEYDCRGIAMPHELAA